MSDHNLDNARNADDWDACTQGELSNMVHRLDARQRSVRRRQVLNTALASTVVFACVVLTLGSFFGDSGNYYGGIPCKLCSEHLADYQLHLIGEQEFEDVELLASMKLHLEKCKFCRSKFNTMYPEQQITAAAATRPVLMFALQPTFTSHSTTGLY